MPKKPQFDSRKRSKDRAIKKTHIKRDFYKMLTKEGIELKSNPALSKADRKLVQKRHDIMQKARKEARELAARREQERAEREAAMTEREAALEASRKRRQEAARKARVRTSRNQPVTSVIVTGLLEKLQEGKSPS
jgi:hypothetical protein